MTTRTYRPSWLRTLRKILHPKRTAKRWIKKRTKKITKRKTVRMSRKRIERHFGTPVTRRGGWDSIKPGRTIVEWIPHPELGRGRVLGFMPGKMLDVEFEQGGRPPSGVEIEDVRILA